ncbi:MAG TPA: metallopeptidase TldD-related protein, partial [Bryobacteraceae bacterium]|nr:metallopeptidase TldD-related protein [Bryobacteraceae bacterium]
MRRVRVAAALRIRAATVREGCLTTAAFLAICGTLAGLAAWAQNPPPKDILQAMKDELDRSRKISLPGLEPPYFIQYTVDRAENFSISASLGGLVSRHHDTLRIPEVLVRVGSYQFDNTNFMGGGRFGSRYELGRFPIEDSYDVLRRFFWLETDTAYKSAVEALSRKRAALRNLTQNDQINDFAHAGPVQHVRPIPPLKIDENLWTRQVRAWSAIFSEYPEVKNSSVEFESSAGGFTMVNTEGSVAREPETVSTLRVRAIAQAADGMTLRDAITFHSLDPTHMPGDAEVERAVRKLAENVVALAHAPKGEDYNGPVLFEGEAGPQILAEVLGRNMALTRRPVSEGGRGGGFAPGELEGRIGARVLPDSFDVVDDPSQVEWHGHPLLGHYEVDREGVLPKPLRLVEKGELKNYLLTRQPVRGFEGSNGRARIPGNYGADIATFSNLFFHSSNTVPAADLKKKLIELCRARSKPYGILIRKMDFPSSASIEEVRRLMAGTDGGRPVSIPILAYKVYPDGREELVRALRFRGLNTRSFKDILAAGNDSVLFEFMDNPAPFALIGGYGFTAEAAVIAPSILIDDLELHPAEEEQPKLPVVPAPELTRARFGIS